MPENAIITGKRPTKIGLPTRLKAKQETYTMSIATTCAIENCTRPIRDKKHSWCYLHYRRNLDHGDPLYERDQKTIAHYNKVEYNIYKCMKSRCLNPKSISYYRYGGRGIKVCDRWMESFEHFLEDMGKRPSALHSIDRIDNDGDYSPENCKWSTKKEQADNRSTNDIVTFRGVEDTLKNHAIKSVIKYRTVWQRIHVYNWTVEDALTKKKED